MSTASTPKSSCYGRTTSTLFGFHVFHPNYLVECVEEPAFASPSKPPPSHASRATACEFPNSPGENKTLCYPGSTEEEPGRWMEMCEWLVGDLGSTKGKQAPPFLDPAGISTRLAVAKLENYEVAPVTCSRSHPRGHHSGEVDGRRICDRASTSFSPDARVAAGHADAGGRLRHLATSRSCPWPCADVNIFVHLRVQTVEGFGTLELTNGARCCRWLAVSIVLQRNLLEQ